MEFFFKLRATSRLEDRSLENMCCQYFSPSNTFDQSQLVKSSTGLVERLLSSGLTFSWMGPFHLANPLYNTDHHDQWLTTLDLWKIFPSWETSPLGRDPPSWRRLCPGGRHQADRPLQVHRAPTGGSQRYSNQVHFASKPYLFRWFTIDRISFIKIQRGRSNHWRCCHLCHRGGVQHGNCQHCGKHQHDLSFYQLIVIIMMILSLLSLLQMSSWSHKPHKEILSCQVPILSDISKDLCKHPIYLMMTAAASFITFWNFCPFVSFILSQQLWWH